MKTVTIHRPESRHYLQPVIPRPVRTPVVGIRAPSFLAPLPKGGWHGEAVTGGFVSLHPRQGTRALPYKIM